MKKVISIVLSLSMIILVLAGCGSAGKGNGTNTTATTQSETTTTPSDTTGTANEDTVKTGLGVISSIAKSTDAGEKEGLAEVDSTIAAVAVDKDGKIVKCVIDAVQSKINFSTTGKITTDLSTEFKSKQELKTEYGMLKSSGIKKEWNEQADAFAAYVVGKTADEVKGIAINEEGKATDTELTSSVTIHVTDFIDAVVKAVNNAQDLGAKSGDKLGLATTTNIAKSTDAGEKDGLAQAYTTYTATTFAADGKITSCIIDASQSNVNFSTAGKITTDLKGAVLKTKNELGTEYGMAKASKIGKEWNEQAAAFAKYVTGKTVEEAKGVTVNEEGVPTAAELTSSVTIHIGDFLNIIEKASATTK